MISEIKYVKHSECCFLGAVRWKTENRGKFSIVSNKGGVHMQTERRLNVPVPEIQTKVIQLILEAWHCYSGVSLHIPMLTKNQKLKNSFLFYNAWFFNIFTYVPTDPIYKIVLISATWLIKLFSYVDPNVHETPPPTPPNVASSHIKRTSSISGLQWNPMNILLGISPTEWSWVRQLGRLALNWSLSLWSSYENQEIIPCWPLTEVIVPMPWKYLCLSLFLKWSTPRRLLSTILPTMRVIMLQRDQVCYHYHLTPIWHQWEISSRARESGIINMLTTPKVMTLIKQPRTAVPWSWASVCSQTGRR